MAIDQNALFQLLTQLQGGGGGAPQPTSGLQDPSLSGLRLGEQGMGLGGGGSLLGGGGGVGTGTEGVGLDLLSLMNQAPEIGPSRQSLGQMSTPATFGAGGQLQGTPPETLGQAARTGMAGVGGGATAGTILALLKTLASVSNKLPGLFGSGSISVDTALKGLGGASGLPDVLTEAGGATAGALGSGLLGTGGEAPLAANLGADVLTEAGAGGGLGAAAATGGLGATGALSAVSGPELLGAGGVLGEAAGTAAGTAGASAAAVTGAELTGGQLLGALSPVGGILSLLSIADLFGAPHIGIGNIFQSQRINDLNAAQTEAAIRQAVALGQQGGPSEVNFQQRGLDAQLIASLFPNLGPVSPRPDDPFQQRLQTVLGTPGATLSLADLQQLSALSPQLQNPSLEPAAFGAQRRFRTLAGFPFVPPPPAIESALDPRAQALFRDTFIPGDA